MFRLFSPSTLRQHREFEATSITGHLLPLQLPELLPRLGFSTRYYPPIFDSDRALKIVFV